MGKINIFSCFAKMYKARLFVFNISVCLCGAEMWILLLYIILKSQYQTAKGLIRLEDRPVICKWSNRLCVISFLCIVAAVTAQASAAVRLLTLWIWHCHCWCGVYVWVRIKRHFENRESHDRHICSDPTIRPPNMVWISFVGPDCSIWICQKKIDGCGPAVLNECTSADEEIISQHYLQCLNPSKHFVIMQCHVCNIWMHIQCWVLGPGIRKKKKWGGRFFYFI